jgi:hypothetical protein
VISDAAGEHGIDTHKYVPGPGGAAISRLSGG